MMDHAQQGRGDGAEHMIRQTGESTREALRLRDQACLPASCFCLPGRSFQCWVLGVLVVLSTDGRTCR